MKIHPLFVISLTLLAACGAFSQTKSFSIAEGEIKAFPDAEKFSLVYDESKYVTVAALSLDVLEKDDPINKQLKKFEWELTSYFAIKGIDANPVRVALCINSQSKRWAFQSNSELTLMFDGESILLGEPNRTSEYRGGKAKERLCWEVDEILIKEFAVAKGVAFTVGYFKGSIALEKLAAFRDYGKLVSVPEM